MTKISTALVREARLKDIKAELLSIFYSKYSCRSSRSMLLLLEFVKLRKKMVLIMTALKNIHFLSYILEKIMKRNKVYVKGYFTTIHHIILRTMPEH